MKTNKITQKIANKIQKNNLIFKKATKAQKRIMIAKDVLAQIKAKRYVSKIGSWVIPHYEESAVLNNDRSAQEMFATGEMKTCNVCALGGLFMSCTNLNNHMNMDQFIDESDDVGHMVEYGQKFSNGLHNFFTKNQLILIERYFENADGWFRTDSSKHIDDFNEKYFTDEARLKAIMQNIINNNGTFVPSKLKV